MNQHRKAITLPVKYRGDFLKKMDGRYGHVRALRRAYAEIVVDTGSENASHIKRSLIQRFVWLECICTSLERRFFDVDAKEAAELVSRWTSASNALLSLAKVLGVERRAKALPSLESYIKSKEKERK